MGSALYWKDNDSLVDGEDILVREQADHIAEATCKKHGRAVVVKQVGSFPNGGIMPGPEVALFEPRN